jgi:hypothetical protein
MSTTTPRVSPLRQRMIEDMRMRKLSAKTHSGYIRAVRHFAGWLHRSPDTASAEDNLHCAHLIRPTYCSARAQIPIAHRHD